MNGRPLVKINDKDIVYTDGSFYDEDRTLSGIVRGIHDYCSEFEKAPALKAEDLTGNYRCLAEFNDTVLAAKYNKGFGFEFVTWERTYNGKGVCHGNYYTDYAEAKENFAVRSGLIDEDKLFDNTELAKLNKCVEFALNNNDDLGFDECESLKKLNEKISDILPEPKQSNDIKMSM